MIARKTDVGLRCDRDIRLDTSSHSCMMALRIGRDRRIGRGSDAAARTTKPCDSESARTDSEGSVYIFEESRSSVTLG